LCGWWHVWGNHGTSTSFSITTEEYGAVSCLKCFDIREVDNQIQDIRDFLFVKYEQRFNMSPFLFEDVVKSVFRDVGFSVVSCGYHKDGGLDAILSNDGKCMVGVQVKRYKEKIAVSLIREFCGALMLRGMTAGVFVTTSKYTKGATQEAHLASDIGVPIQPSAPKNFVASIR
jgi:restriction system protein